MRLNIATQIGLGFGIITAAVIVNAFISSTRLERSRQVNEEISNIYTPSLEYINELYTNISDSRMLIKSWVFIDKISDTPDKLKLKKLHSTTYPMLMDTLDHLKSRGDGWSAAHQKLLEEIQISIEDTLFKKHKYIMRQLSSFESYDDPFVIFEVNPMAEEGGEVMSTTERILANITILKKEQEELVTKARETMVLTFDSFKKVIFIMALVLVFVAITMGLITIQSLARPINHTKQILQEMSKGILPEEKLKEGKDEIGQMAAALNSLVQSLKDILHFSTEIAKGNFESEFKPLSDEDLLGHSLINMRKELKEASEEEKKRQQEDEERNWSSQGIALFSDILRKNNDNLDELTYNIISNLVKYTKSNQGGIFIINDVDKNETFLEMKACYAFDRKKFMQKRVELNEGLIGRCYLEKDYIFLTEIPQDYINITSGLGDDNPRSLLLVPLIYNDEIFGIVEIASFYIYKDFEIDFVKRVAESIAATISSVKSTIQTAQLLEQSQQQAEEMAAQEEEMRQNMEELRATQEQSTRREKELSEEVEELRQRLTELTQQK